MHKPIIAIHGGAGTLLKGMMTEEKENAYRAVLSLALDQGFNALKKGSLEAVEVAVKVMEDSPLFNAGKGSVFNAAGSHEMDASIMNGANLKAGAVALAKNIKNPVSLARGIMDKSDHVFMAGAGAMEFAKELGYAFMPDDYFYDELRFNQWQEIKNTDAFQLDHSIKKDSKFGTVGAVACDVDGNLAAATSTGGMTNKKYGRVGDSPMIGAGTYANNDTCAVSCTGSGEFFIRAAVAYDVSCLMEYKGLSLLAACEKVILEKLPKIGGDGGLIALNRNGDIALTFNTEGMYRGYINAKGEKYIAIYQ